MLYNFENWICNLDFIPLINDITLYTNEMCASMSKSSAARKRIKKANLIQSPLDNISIDFSDPKYTISSIKMSNRPHHIQEWVFEMIKASVSHFYDDSCPWFDHEKRAEILHPDMWNILASTGDCNLGFLNFRFDMDEGYDVVYVYEVQVDPQAQRMGIGTLLVRIVEKIAFENKITKVVLTSHRKNTVSQKFFREKLGYSDDESSPTFESVNYDILSKYIHQ